MKGSKTTTNTSFMMQYEDMIEEGIVNLDPLGKTLKDPTALITEWSLKGYHPVVMGDLNSEISEKELEEFIDVNGLQDLIANYNEGTPPRTCNCGPRCIDFILGNKFVEQTVVQSGALGEHEGLISNHTA